MPPSRTYVLHEHTFAVKSICSFAKKRALPPADTSRAPARRNRGDGRAGISHASANGEHRDAGGRQEHGMQRGCERLLERASALRRKRTDRCRVVRLRERAPRRAAARRSRACRRLAKIVPKIETPIEPPICRKSVEPDVATPMQLVGRPAFCTASTSTCITIPSPRPSTTHVERRLARSASSTLEPREQEHARAPSAPCRRSGTAGSARARLISCPLTIDVTSTPAISGVSCRPDARRARALRRSAGRAADT